jgi:wyosine [tRNA(Phe)-imidazoG37] synthetase (radical SAM superfamily)
MPRGNRTDPMGNGVRCSFGPVPSRRLGKSLGINNIPAKVCSYSCVYCQVGVTRRLEYERRRFYSPEDVFLDVRSRLSDAGALSERVDYLAFVPDGEPTLDVNLGKEIALLKPLGVPVGVITNASLIQREDVREDLGKADWVSVKIDTVREALWRRIDRPHPDIRHASILDGLLRFAKSFSGQLVTETMVVNGYNDSLEDIQATANFLHQLEPHTSYLSVPTRPPAEKRVKAPDPEALIQWYQHVSEKVRRVEHLVGYEGDAFASTGDIEHDLLSITAVHPMREKAVEGLLKQADAPWAVVERLLSRGDLLKKEYNGHAFYLRRF